MTRYAKPETVEEALALLAAGSWRVLAGGTDFYPSLGAKPLRENVLDINGLQALRGISEDTDAWTIGARTTWTDIVRQPLPAAFDGLKAAAREVGSIQIQNTGTVAGNLCNASPAADGVPPLMTLDAEVELASKTGRRRLRLEEFVLGNRKTGRRTEELLVAIRIPRLSAAGRSAFVKLGARRYLVISIAMVAARIAVDGDGRIAQAAIAVGACSAVARRLPELESDLIGRPAGGRLGDIVEDRHLWRLSPIDDVRGSAAYRRAAAREIVARALSAATAREALAA
ncbi:MAG: xanthine dehydrogenase family protein subunit M [Rhizobiaceae bacterium]